MATDLKTLTCDDYHVAWICAVADIEQLPACLMLDEEHATPTYDTHYDENTYTCGSINGHTVVGATCSQGETGNVNAGHLAQALFKTFRNIRMALLVGIGGGIPNPDVSENPLKNIHLGDVVVGFPGDGSPGCVYYERGRAKDNGGFELVGAMQNPDYRLTQALGKLAMDYKRKRVDFDKHLARLRDPDLDSEFARPKSQHDRLFDAAYNPEGGHRPGCATCDEGKLVRRPERTDASRARLVYHQGRIATGNAVIRSAKLRDEISLRCEGALCVEMEAAGVDVNRRCLVIRGISDYADCHKSDVWQSYAAGNAAAFARELLCRVQPAAVKEMEAKVVKAPWLVPLPRPQSFVGRREPLEQLRTCLSSDDRHRLAIYGLGGCGKTALALEIAYLSRQDKPKCAVFWVSAVDRDSFEQAYRDVARLLCIPGLEDPKTDVKRLVKEKLDDECSGSWLMVVDNADDADVLLKPFSEDNRIRLIDYVPKLGNGSVIFTTRTKKVAIDLAGSDLVQLDRLSAADAIDLLKSRLLPEHQQQLKDTTTTQTFLETLAFHALAIVQAIAFVNKNSTLAEYVQLYETNEQSATHLLSEEFEDQGRYRSIKNAVATTWAISFLHIQKYDQLAAEYLQFMACVLNNDIPESMLPSAASAMDHAKAIGTLQAYAFIVQRDPQDEEVHSQTSQKSFDMHPLVHLATKRWLMEREIWDLRIQIAAERMQIIVPFGGLPSRKGWMPYLTHAIHVCSLLGPSQKELWANLIDRISDCHYDLGQYEAVERCCRQLHLYEEDSLGEKHENTLRSLHFIGIALHQQGKYKEAEQMHRRALALKKDVLGVQNNKTLHSMHELALAINRQGRFAEAESLQREHVALSQTVNGDEHRSTLLSISALASSLMNLGEYAEAGEMLRKVIDLQSRMLGSEHTDTLQSMEVLASVLGNQRQYGKAEDMQRRVLDLEVQALGLEHSNTLVTMNNLGLTFRRQGKYKAAENLLCKVVELSEKLLGKEHPSTLATLTTLSQALNGQGRKVEAVQLQRKVLGKSQTLLGEDHPDTLVGMSNLAGMLSDYGSSAESEKLHRRTLQLREKALGETHPDTLKSVYGLGIVLNQHGNYEEAFRCFERALRGFKKVFGPDHPRTRSAARKHFLTQEKIKAQSSGLEESVPKEAQNNRSNFESEDSILECLTGEDGSADGERRDTVAISRLSGNRISSI